MANTCAWFFDEIVVTNADYTRVPTRAFGIRATAMMSRIDAGVGIEYSFNGVDRHGIFRKADQFAAWDGIDQSQIWIKLETGTTKDVTMRLWAWIKQK